MTDAAAPTLELRGVEVLYLAFRALRGVDLTLGGGEIVGLIGPNGAGKTTMLNVAATLLRPARGSMHFRGAPLPDHTEELRSALGYMPHDFGVYDDLRVGEYLTFFGEAYRLGTADAARRIDSVLERMALGEVREKYVAALSTGMRQRLFFAKTLLHEPTLLLLDEPFTGLDPIASRLMSDAIRAEAARGAAVLVASHYLPELESLATRIVAIRSGQVVSHDVQAASSAAELAVAKYVIRVEGEAEGAAGTLRTAFPAATVTVSPRGELLVEIAAAGASTLVLRALLDAGIAVERFSNHEQDLRAFFERTLGSGADA